MNLVIVGLRRSGTTAFWGLFREDERFACYNEPFNQQLRHAGSPGWQGGRHTEREFDTLQRRDPAAFWHHYAPVARHDELKDGLSDQQAHWLAWLQATAEHTCVDVTRCHFKLASLRDVDPDAVVVHLYRPPANWVTSVVQPSTAHIKRLDTAAKRLWHTTRLRVQAARFRQTFWQTRDGHRFKGFDELIGTHEGTYFGVRLAEAGMDPAEVYAMPDVGRLLAFWKLHYERVERDGPSLFGERFLSVNFNDACHNPRAVRDRVYDRLGMTPPAAPPRGIHPPPPPFASRDPRWGDYTRRLGLPDLE